MRRAFKLLFGALVVVVLVAVAFVAWYVFGERARRSRSSSAPRRPRPAGRRRRSARGTSCRAQHVYVGYRIKELFGDAVLKHDAVGRTPAVTGTTDDRR